MYRYIKLWAYAVSVNIYNCRNKKSCENTVSLKVQYFFHLHIATYHIIIIKKT